MAHETASDSLPSASDMLPAAEVVALPRAKKAGPPRRARITKAVLSKLVCPPGRTEAIYWDTEVRGLGLRTYPSGRRVWVVQYRDGAGRTRRTPIGQAATVDPVAAKKMARELLARVAAGANPSVERKATRRASRVADVTEAYLIHCEKEQRSSSFDHVKRNLNKYARPLHREAIAGVDRAAIARLHQRLGNDVGRVQANRVLASLSAMWVWGLRTGLITGDNPCAYVPKFSERARDRVLSPEELCLIWRCTGRGRTYDRMVRLILLTACRRQEIGAMCWGEIEGDLLTVPASRMKRKRPHEVPLSALAVEQLPERKGDGCMFSTSSNGFDGWDKAKKDLDKRIADSRIAAGVGPKDAAIPAWGLHDLRRTFSTMMHELGLADPHVIEAVLAHEGAQSGVAGIYNRAAYREQKRAALEAWAKIVTETVGAR